MSEQQPEYNFTQHEIDLVNQDRIHLLERDWLKRTGNLALVQQQPLSPDENEAAPTVVGSSPNTIHDFDHQQQVVALAQTRANDYAYTTKRKVDAMYDEAYAANADPLGAQHYFLQQQAKERPQGRRGILKQLMRTK